ncbi:MAG: transporter substrate-binding domain-containing protein [Sneathiella sp.]
MTKYTCSISLIMPILLFLVSGYNALADETLVLNTTVSVPLSNKSITGVTDLQLAEVFKRAGIAMEIEHLPAERSLINADKGIDDGTFLRVSGLNRIYQNLVEVPESFMDFEFVAMSKNGKINIQNWESLQPYSLGIINGWKIVEENTKNAKTVTTVQNVDQLFRLLELDRADIIIYEKLRALVALGKNPIENVVILEPAIVQKPMFLYLNKKHEHLIPKIVDALRSSKADGTHEFLMNKALKPYLDPK